MREPCPDCRCLTSSAPDPCPECAAERKRAERARVETEREYIVTMVAPITHKTKTENSSMTPTTQKRDR